MIIATWQTASSLQNGANLDEPVVVLAMNQISQVWEHLFPVEQHRILRLLVERIQLQSDGLEILWRYDGWHSFSQQLAGHPFVAEQRNTEATIEP